MRNLPLLRSLPRTLLLAGITSIAFAPLQALAQVSVNQVLMAVEHRSEGNVVDGWYFLTDVAGTGILSGRLGRPGGGFKSLIAPPGGAEAFFEDGPFETLNLLHQTYAKGSYTLTVNGAHTVTLAWNPPGLTTGSTDPPLVTNTAPAHESTSAETPPNYSFTTNCTNCTLSEVCILNRSGVPDAIDACADADEPPLPTSFAYSELTNGGTSGPIPRLPGWDYEMESFQSVSRSTLGHEFRPAFPMPFTFVREAAVLDLTVFTVPEPGALTAHIAAMTAAMLLARRHRRPR
jgi:hypothetical protein